MKATRVFLALVSCVVLVAALTPSATASCLLGGVLETAGEYLVSNPEWGGVAGLGTCNWGCYASESEPPISPDFDGVFWAFGYGDPRPGWGIDSGTLSIDEWSKARRCTPADGCLETYYYPAWLTTNRPEESNSIAGNPVNWSSPGIDGCPTDAEGPGPDPEECVCVLLSDQWHGRGFFAVLSAYSHWGLFDLTTGDVIRLAPLPPPVLGPMEGERVVVVPPEIPTESLFLKGCPCTILGYKVYEQIVPTGSSPPENRSLESGWQIAEGGASPSGEPIPLDSEARIRCSGAAGHVIHLAYTLVFDSGFELPVVSESSPPLSDCPTLTTFADLSFTQVELSYDAESENHDGFEVRGAFALDPRSDGIAPPSESVAVTVGASSTTIPAGSFRQDGEVFEFVGVLGSVEVEFEIRQVGDASFAFRIEVRGGDLTGTTNPVGVELDIGGDSGRAMVRLGGSLTLDRSSARPRSRRSLESQPIRTREGPQAPALH